MLNPEFDNIFFKKALSSDFKYARGVCRKFMAANHSEVYFLKTRCVQGHAVKIRLPVLVAAPVKRCIVQPMTDRETGKYIAAAEVDIRYLKAVFPYQRDDLLQFPERVIFPLVDAKTTLSGAFSLFEKRLKKFKKQPGVLREMLAVRLYNELEASYVKALTKATIEGDIFKG